MDKKLIIGFGLGALMAGMVGYLASGPAATPVKEVVVAQVEEPKQEALPASSATSASEKAPEIEVPHKTPLTVYPPAAPARAAEKPAPRRARPAEAEARSSSPAAAAPAKSNEVPRVEASPMPAAAPAAASVQNEPKPAMEVLKPEPAAAAPVPMPKKREAQTVTIKEGTVIAIRTAEVISSEKQQSGDVFTAALADPIIVDGFVLAERGSRVTGRIVESVPAGKVKGVARLSLELTQVNLIDGQKLQLATDPFLREGASSKKSDAAKVGAGAAIGAALGGIFGGGKGAAIGGAAGAGAGGGAVILTRGKPVEIESETRLPFRLSRTLTVTEKL